MQLLIDVIGVVVALTLRSTEQIINAAERKSISFFLCRGWHEGGRITLEKSGGTFNSY